MAKRSLGDLNDSQRRVLREWSHHMGVGDAQMINMLNSLDNLKADSPWRNLDIAARVVHECDDC